MQSPVEQPFIELAARIGKLERYVEALRATEQRGFRGARVSHNANQTITSGLTTDLNFNGEIFDFGGLHDNTTNNQRLTIPADGDGYWLFLATLRWSNTAAAFVETQIVRKPSGTEVVIAQDVRVPNPAGGGTTGLTLCTFDQGLAGDYFTVRVYNPGAASVDILSIGGLSPRFIGIRIPT
jgi:hypothetical protein